MLDTLQLGGWSVSTVKPAGHSAGCSIGVGGYELPDSSMLGCFRIWDHVGHLEGVKLLPTATLGIRSRIYPTHSTKAFM